MIPWVRRGLQTGVRSTRYPASDEHAAGVSPGLPLGGTYSELQLRTLLELCPTGALSCHADRLEVNYARCIHCFRCARADGAGAAAAGWAPGYEWAMAVTGAPGRHPALGAPFGNSVSIRVVDAGDCGACLNEVKQLNSPYYNMHRLGFFITPTPRQADLLLVVGALTDHMRLPLQKAYDAMPEPKRVIAVGACALSGGVFGSTFVSGGGIASLLPVDVVVPGNPPPPLAILHGLLVAVGRRPPFAVVHGSDLREGNLAGLGGALR